MDFLINSAYAQAAGGAPGSPSLISTLALPALLFRPQSKRAKEQQEMLSKVAVGDEIATAGGILGKVTEVGDQFLSVEIADGVNVKLQKFQVAKVLPKGTVKSA
jgi:preprotein translocase subunit YajC